MEVPGGPEELGLLCRYLAFPSQPGLRLWNEELIGFLTVCFLSAPLAVPFLGAHFSLRV